ncbi:MAG: hypothetical protein O7G85_12655, partial [Planctomycetota bacterium]|nr:hypothetical protein [Planctomycetota bacterium]
MLTPRPRPRIRILSNRLLKQATLGLGVASTLLILNPVQAQRNSLPAGYRAPSSYVQAAQTQAFKHQVRQNQGQGHAYGRQRQQSRWNQGQPAGWDQGQGSDIRGQGGRGGQGYCGTQVIT